MYLIIQSICLSLLLLTLQTSAAPKTSPSFPKIQTRNSSPGYGTLSTTTNGSIIRATINNPPINLWDYKLAADFSSFVDGLAHNNNTGIKVVIISSANPDFFIAHYDIHVLDAASPVSPPGNATDIGLQLIRTRSNLATLPVIFITEINGRTSGAGNELVVQTDIRYAGPNALLSHLEVGFGLLPGAGGVQFLVKLIGRARALEYILSGRSVDAATAAAIGWVNKAFGSQQELRSEVEALAARIAAFPEQGLAAIKARVNVQKPSDADLQGDLDLFDQLAATNVTQEASDRFLELSGDETADSFELNLSDDLVEMDSGS
ncbi:hypothetical protein MMC28_001676 [Mycoblastus sanguinarius]|nr:hypothetical protein [Mycoblastus sanguinarius]